MVKVSVIVPVYNVEEYLSECLDSVINQTFDDFEVICVNDCSTDSSLKILKEYVLSDSRIKIVQTEVNSGLGFARNHGLKYANGEYILFLDSDDYILDTTLERLYENATHNNSDIVLFKFLHLVNGHFSYNYIPINLDKFLKRTDFENFVFDYKIAPYITLNEQYSACIKFYKKSFLESYDDFYFPVGLAYEDVPFHVKVMLRASRMTFIPECFYVYRRSVTSSITHNYSHVYDILKIIALVEDFLKDENHFDELIVEFYKFKVRQLLMYINQSKYEDFFELAKEQLENLNIPLVYSSLYTDDKHYELINDFENVLNSNTFEDFISKKNVVQNNLPNFTIVVSVKNNFNMINICLDSIFSVFLEDFEVLCIDEGSSDDSLKKMLNYRIEHNKDFLIYFDQNVDSKELGLKLARGQHILFISGDEYIHDKIACLDKLNQLDDKIIPSEDFVLKIPNSLHLDDVFPKLSIIIPVYNCENSISKCLNSLLSQSFTDFEIICVNDGSTDNSLKVLNDFAIKYDCINVLSQENKGSGAARNLGLSASVGKYISFVDADDTVVNPNAYDQIIEFAEKYNVNMVSANLQILKRGKLVFEDNDFKKIEKLNFKSPAEYGIPWFFYKNVFNRTFLMENQIIFPNLKRGQDTVFLANVLSKLDEYLEVPISFYQYVAPIGSKINSFISYLGYYESFYEVFKILTPQKRFTKLINVFSQKLIDIQYLKIPIEIEEELVKLLYIFDKLKDLFIIWDDISLLEAIINSFNKVINKCNVDISISIDDYYKRYSFLFSQIIKPDISVILPVFNMESYLGRSINSILMQSFSNLEIICIDDFSTDNSYKILKNFQNSDRRIKVLKNDYHRGLGYTKNRGILESKGKYIYFLNPYDWINLESFEFLFNNAEKDSLELIISEPIIFNEDTFDFEFNLFNFTSIIKLIRDKNNNLTEINFNELINMSFTNLFVLKSFLVDNNIFFSDKLYSDNLNFFFEVLFKVKNFRFIDVSIQNYVIGENIVKNHIFVNLWFVQLILNFFLEKRLYVHYKKNLLNFIFNLLRANLLDISSKINQIPSSIETEFINELHLLFDKLYFDYNLYDDFKENLTKDNFYFFNKFLVNKSKYRMSIIIPIFNAELYLKRNLDSILNQYLNFKSIEVIMVDDSSTDGSAKIMKEYCNKYPKNFKAIFLDENSGYAGKPRNVALSHVNSNYVSFLDADDYVMKNGYKRLYQEIITEDSDIVIGNYTSDLPSGNKKYYIDAGIASITSINEYSKLKFDSIDFNEHILASVNIWNKLFKLDVINENKIVFPEGVPAEDSAFLLNYLFNANGIIFVNELVNHYTSLRNTDVDKSVSYLRNKVNIFGRLQSYKFMHDLSKKYGKEEEFCKFLLVNKLIYLFDHIFETELDNEELILIFKEYQILFERIIFYDLNDSNDLKIIFEFIANSQFNEALSKFIDIKNEKYSGN